MILYQYYIIYRFTRQVNKQFKYIKLKKFKVYKYFSNHWGHSGIKMI